MLPSYSNEAKDRIKKINDLKAAGVIPYANHFHWKMDIKDIRKEENKIKDAKELMEEGAVGEFKTAWRVMLSRSMWKLIFMTIQDNTDKIQLCFMKWKTKFNKWNGELVEELEIDGEVKNAHKIAEKYILAGDYIWVIWDLFVTKHWELTLFVKEFQILSKAVRPLPEKFHGVTDQETLYRQRYLDLIMNQDTYDRFLLRSKFLKVIREFYEKNGFLEIETPVLWNAASGAAAQPFITHHNDFDIDVYLRIAPEVNLKKATVGRFERVFEVSRNFRNEGSDPSHMQEFTAIEHYAAWWNFEDNMKFTEEMFDYIFEKLWLDKKIKIKDKDGIEKEVNFTTPFEKIDYIAWVKDKCGIDVSLYWPWDEEKLRKTIEQAWYTWEGIEKQATATMIDYLYKKVLRPSIVWPAFVYNYPKTMQPLARQNDENPNIVEQFQLVINGWEVLKAYSELVDPKIQQENFDAQTWAILMWDEEATSGDDEFVLAMEYGMPCQSGWGMGIERILALLTGQDNLRDVFMFPLMKPEEGESKKEKVENIKVEEIELKNDDKAVEDIKLPSREEVLKLVDKYAKWTKQHLIQVGDIMEYFAEKLWQNKDYWWMVWVLHDIDWDFIEKDGNRHCKEDLEKICSEINVPKQIVDDVKSHAYGLVDGIEEKPDTLVRKYLCSVDELSWFMWAYFRMIPSDNVADIKVKSIKKKIKDKSFASGVDRNEVKNCETKLNIPLDEFIEDIKKAWEGKKYQK